MNMNSRGLNVSVYIMNMNLNSRDGSSVYHGLFTYSLIPRCAGRAATERVLARRAARYIGDGCFCK